MGVIVVIVANVIGPQPLQMTFVESEDVIEQIMAAAFHPALGHSVLPSTLDRSLHVGDCRERIAAGTSRPYFGS
jgi:hypothetical protein